MAECLVVDVFAEKPLSGNQLAVVLDAGDLSTAQMQAIALETNFSETTFVTTFTENRADVRIFTPTCELPFAGHPVLGTAWVLAEHASAEPLNTVTLSLAAGEVPVSFDRASNILWLDSPDANFSDGVDRTLAAEMLGLEPDDFLSNFPVLLADIGPKFHLIAVRDLHCLSRCRINSDTFNTFQAGKNGVEGLFVFSPQGHDDTSDYAARMFFDAGGPREDPATGSANCAFAAYLYQQLSKEINYRVDQGVEMGRPSAIYLNANADGIKVGGKVQAVLAGKLLPAALGQ